MLTPSSVEYSRSTESARMMFARVSQPFNVPCERERSALVTDCETTNSDDPSVVENHLDLFYAAPGVNDRTHSERTLDTHDPCTLRWRP